MPTSGASFAILGSGFGTGSRVRIGGAGVTSRFVAADQIVATATAHAAGAVSVTVENPDGQTATLASAFRYIAPGPNNTTLNIHGSPMAGGGLLLVAGSGFQPGASVKFGGVSATGVSVDTVNKVIQVTIPRGPGGVQLRRAVQRVAGLPHHPRAVTRRSPAG